MSSVENDRREWHLQKSISVGHLITTFVVAASALMYIGSLEAKLGQHELQIQTIKEQRDRDSKRVDASFAELKSDLKDISRKLDRMLERE